LRRSLTFGGSHVSTRASSRGHSGPFHGNDRRLDRADLEPDARPGVPGAAHCGRQTQPDRNLAGYELGQLDIQAHPAKMGPVVALAAAFSVAPGPGVVEGNEIPYKPEAAAKKKENATTG